MKGIGELTPHLPPNYEEKSKGNSVKVSTPSLPPKKKDVGMFHGFEVPHEPREPESNGWSNLGAYLLSADTFVTLECCMSGCAVCVYDLYEESMDAYKDAVLGLCSSLSSLKIPQSEWPPSIRAQSLPVSSSSSTNPDRQRKEVVMSAFEELEKALNAKQQDAATGEARVDSVRR